MHYIIINDKLFNIFNVSSVGINHTAAVCFFLLVLTFTIMFFFSRELT